MIPWRTVRPLKTDEIYNPVEIKKREAFDKLIERRWDISINPPKAQSKWAQSSWKEYDDEMEKPRVITNIEDTVDVNGRLLNQQPAYDKLLNNEVKMQVGNEWMSGKVVQRAVNPDGEVEGEYDDNPFLNSHMYEVEFSDGSVREYSANLIAENMLTQVDEEGYSKTLLNAIIDH